MKKLYLLVFFLNLAGYTQSYKFGAYHANSAFIKAEGTIVISDKKISIESIANKTKTVVEYDAFKDKAGLIYVIDGTMIHTLTFLDEKGKKKGFEHDTVILFTLDKSKDNAQIKYYCTLSD